MSTDEILTRADQHGVRLTLQGDQLRIEADTPPPAEWLAALRQHKAEIIARLRPRPYFTRDGTLVIPFNSDPKYHWWKGGQSVAATRAELQTNPRNEP